MDKIWLENKLDLAMTAYKVVGTDCMQGFLEFIADSCTLADIQHQGTVAGLFETFSDNTMVKFFNKEVHKEILKVNKDINVNSVEY